jgi:hypothetical protein
VNASIKFWTGKFWTGKFWTGKLCSGTLANRRVTLSRWRWPSSGSGCGDLVNARKLDFVTREKRILLVAFSRKTVTFARSDALLPLDKLESASTQTRLRVPKVRTR